jgi:probable F420-dependent oxidoreductase
MKLGVMSFNTEYSVRADELAVEAEARGFESVWFPEHTHIPASRKTEWPAGGELPKEYAHMSDPFVSAGAAAAVTSTIKIGTGVSLIAQHEPLALAKTVATVDRIAEGRFMLGIGAGWNQDEMENHGVRYEERWKVCIEHLEAMKELWTQEEASYHGKYVNFDKVWSYPKPYQSPHPPIILGTLASKYGRARAAKHADGWIPVGTLHGDLEGDVRDMHEQLRSVGRDPADFPISLFDIFETPEGDLKRFAEMGLFERAIPRIPTEDRDTVLRWLDSYAKLNESLA